VRLRLGGDAQLMRGSGALADAGRVSGPGSRAVPAVVLLILEALILIPEEA
jgi:hypothetical protein